MKNSKTPSPVIALALLICTAAYVSTVGATQPTGVPASPKNSASNPPVRAVNPEQGSYDVGLMLGSQLEHNGVASTLSLDAVIKGLKDAVGGRAITGEEREAALQFMRDARTVFAEKNRAAAHEFLEKNAKQPGIITTPSGLQYRVLTKGDPKSKSPAPTDRVTVRYRASLADGTEFDRSDIHGQPATFRVNSVFKGWQEALLTMKIGAKWQLFVPPELGYGANSPPAVPPGALLVYELELFQIEPAAPLDPAAARPPPAPRAPH
ncbi:MAG: FKBP-type peptidyl-prolyl cis-trans isomerase [Gammaproteobacteria bacterium]